MALHICTQNDRKITVFGGKRISSRFLVGQKTTVTTSLPVALFPAETLGCQGDGDSIAPIPWSISRWRHEVSGCLVGYWADEVTAVLLDLGGERLQGY